MMNKITVAKEELIFNHDIYSLNKSHSNDNDLNKKLNQDGYLYLKHFFERSLLNSARENIINDIKIKKITPKSQMLDELYTKKYVLDIVESEKLFSLFDKIFNKKSITYDYKWLRLINQGDSTDIHIDKIYMGRGSNKLLTAWIPFQDTPMELGTLAVCEKSNHFEDVVRKYGSLDVDITSINNPNLSSSPTEISKKFGGIWKTNDFELGDIIIFSINTLHCSTMNKTNKQRISCDVRFQPEDENVDDRWYGPNRTGHTLFENVKENTITMKELKSFWKI